MTFYQKCKFCETFISINKEDIKVSSKEFENVSDNNGILHIEKVHRVTFFWICPICEYKKAKYNDKVISRRNKNENEDLETLKKKHPDYVLDDKEEIEIFYNSFTD